MNFTMKLRVNHSVAYYNQYTLSHSNNIHVVIAICTTG